MARRSYLQRIAQPLRAGDPVLFALPRAPSAEARAATEAPATRAAVSAKLPPSSRRPTPPAAYAPDAASSHKMLGRAQAPADAPAEATTSAPRERRVLADAPPPPSFTELAPREPAPTRCDADPPPATVAHALPRPTAPQVPGASVPVVRPPSTNGTVAAPRIHIGTVEVRSHTQPPAPLARPTAPAARRADTPPISRGYAWHFGLIQG